MGLFNFLNRSKETPSAQTSAPRAMAGDSVVFSGFHDPAFKEFVRGGAGQETAAGVTVTVEKAMKNTTVIRCVSLLSFSIGMLPLHLHWSADNTKADDHTLFKILHRRPNVWQTAFEFRCFMEQRLLQKGDAYALKVRNGDRILQLVPLTGDVVPRQRTDWSLEYVYTRPDGRKVVYGQEDIFHVRYGLSEDGITGLSLVKQAAEAIALAIQTERAAARLFKNGMIVGGAITHNGQLSPESFDRLNTEMSDYFAGADNAHRWMILEEGMEAKPFAQTGRESQQIETRGHQIEEVSRPFGVPRPLLNVKDTSWGSGIDVLGQLFVRYGLNPQFESWQQAIYRDLLTDREQDQLEPKFNAGALLRGSMKDQAEFFARGLGSGGHQPWLEPNEVRGWLDMPPSNDLPPPPGQNKGTAQ